MTDTTLGVALTLDDYALPGLRAGDYAITVSHGLSLDGEAPVANIHRFSVAGPRYRLPENTVHARFPNDGDQGDLSGVLPHVVLKGAHSAWLTDLGIGGDVRLPSLALLVCTEDELEFGPEDSARPGGDARHRCFGGAVRDFWDQFAGESGRVGPQCAVSDAEKHSDTPCRYIRLKAELFRALLPRFEDLPWTAHVRRTQGAADSQDSDYSVVAAVRLPSSVAASEQRGYIVHLVSLEGWGSLLPGAEGADGRLEEHCAKGHHFCLISLANWTFTATGNANGHPPFAALARGLAEKDGKGRDLRLLHPAAQSEKVPPQLAPRLADGFVPLPHRAWTGEQLFAWYRGPLVPVQSRQEEHSGLWEQFSDALVVDAQDQVLDVSYAAAWYLGRNLSLADRGLMQSWFNVLKRLRHRTLRSAKQGFLQVRAEPSSAGLTAGLLTGNLLAAVPQLVKQPASGKPFQARSSSPVSLGHFNFSLGFSLADEDILSSLPTSDLNVIVSTVAAMLRLEPVPFAALVPYPEMLPPESLRVFRIDTQWQQALIDGALSVGLRRRTDAAIYEALRERLWQAVRENLDKPAARIGQVSLQALAKPFDAVSDGTEDRPLSGVLLCSELVGSWPDLRLLAEDGDGRSLGVVRRAKLGPNVKLWLFDGVVSRLRLAPPAALLPPGVSSEEQIYCRSLAKDSLGGILEGAEPISVAGHWRDAGRRIFALGGKDGLVAAISREIRRVGGPMAGDILSPAEMAVQWLTAPAELILQAQGTAK
ncbi:MAG TPA: hypothetical protein VFF03_02310 [Rhodocyclaceae bacterium]|nr:hypothetical protein [Rhodocyclaceae bacterium]